MEGVRIVEVVPSESTLTCTMADEKITAASDMSKNTPVGKLLLTWKPVGEAVEPFSGETIIRLRSKDQDVILRLVITGYVTGDVMPSPTRIVFGDVTPGATVERSCKLTWKTLADCQKDGCVIESDHSFVSGELEQSDRGRAERDLHIVATIPRDGVSGLISGVMKCSIGGRTFCRIPYLLRIPETSGRKREM